MHMIKETDKRKMEGPLSRPTHREQEQEQPNS